MAQKEIEKFGETELNELRASTPYSLPDSPTKSGWSASSIKKQNYQGYFLLLTYINRLIDLLNANIDLNETDRQAILEEITSAKSRLSTLENRAGTHESGISSLKSDVSALQTDFSKESGERATADANLQANIDKKQDILTAGRGIGIENNSVFMKDEYKGSPSGIAALTKSQYDNIVSSNSVKSDVFYVITDGTESEKEELLNVTNERLKEHDTKIASLETVVSALQGVDTTTGANITGLASKITELRSETQASDDSIRSDMNNADKTLQSNIDKKQDALTAGTSILISADKVSLKDEARGTSIGVAVLTQSEFESQKSAGTLKKDVIYFVPEGGN